MCWCSKESAASTNATSFPGSARAAAARSTRRSSTSPTTTRTRSRGSMRSSTAPTGTSPAQAAGMSRLGLPAGKQIFQARRLAAVVLAFAVSAHAQTFPTKPLRIVVPYTPGGLMDLMGRQLGQSLPETLGQPVVVENRPGAASAVGIEYVKQAPADGYTMVV